MTEHRHLKKLQAQVDRVLEGDRLFFERHPRRKHRIRLQSRAEIEMEVATSGVMRVPPSDVSLFVIVKSLRPGVRLRAPCDGPRDADTNLPEETCAGLYEALADRRPEMRKREKDLITAFGVA